MGGVDEVDVGFTTFTLKNWHVDCTCRRSHIFNQLHGRTGVRELTCHDLNLQHSEGETVDFLGVDGRFPEGLWWHVGQGSRAHGEGRHVSV